MGGGHDPGGELRSLPAVHELAGALEATGAPRSLAVRAARRAIDERRAALRAAGAAGLPPLPDRARELLGALERPPLRRVLNATGVIVHTGLGRAPLAAPAQRALAEAAAGYSNLELDLEGGGRGDRQDHVRAMLCELTGAQD